MTFETHAIVICADLDCIAQVVFDHGDGTLTVALDARWPMHLRVSASECTRIACEDRDVPRSELN